VKKNNVVIYSQKIQENNVLKMVLSNNGSYLAYTVIKEEISTLKFFSKFFYYFY